MRTFVTKCVVGDIVTEGEGNGKKVNIKDDEGVNDCCDDDGCGDVDGCDDNGCDDDGCDDDGCDDDGCL